MKKLLLALLALSFTHVGFAQSKSVDALYQKHKSNKDFFHLDLGGNILGLANSFNVNLDESSQASLSQSMEKLRLFKIPGNAEFIANEYTSLRKSLEKERFELMMDVGKRGQGVAIYSKGNRRISDIVLLVRDEKGELLVVEAEGDFDPQVISRMGGR